MPEVRPGASSVPFLRYGGLPCLVAVLLVSTPGRGAVPAGYLQDAEPPPTTGMLGSSITDVVWSGRYLWVSTERGLARLDPSRGDGLEAGHWVTFTEEHGLGRGAVSALAAHGDTVWAATLFDSLTAGNRSRQVGSGISWSTDAGARWQRISNEALFDTLRPGFEDGPWTPVENACFGLAVEGDTVWATFFAGSAVRSIDFGRTWERVLPGGADRIVYNNTRYRVRVDSLEDAGAAEDVIARAQAAADSIDALSYLHRTFSVAAYGDTVWIGTALGVASSFDFGRTWTVHRSRRDESGQVLPGHLSAHWGVAVERQIRPDGRSVVWVGTKVTDEPPGQVRAIHRTEDDGDTWTSSGPTFAWDFAFAPDSVWAGTEEGLLLSPDHGESWLEVPVQDILSQDLLRAPFIGVERFSLPDGRIALWAGADNGLGRSLDDGRTWTILSFPVRVRAIDTGRMIDGEGLVDTRGAKTYAAPSPFAPSRGQSCMVVYSLAEADEVSVDIYDFSSRKVRALVDGESRPGGRHHREPWDGLDDGGGQVANGVYFFRVETASGSRAFGNVVVLD